MRAIAHFHHITSNAYCCVFVCLFVFVAFYCPNAWCSSMIKWMRARVCHCSESGGCFVENGNSSAESNCTEIQQWLDEDSCFLFYFFSSFHVIKHEGKNVCIGRWRWWRCNNDPCLWVAMHRCVHYFKQFWSWVPTNGITSIILLFCLFCTCNSQRMFSSIFAVVYVVVVVVVKFSLFIPLFIILIVNVADRDYNANCVSRFCVSFVSYHFDRLHCVSPKRAQNSSIERVSHWITRCVFYSKMRAYTHDIRM